jgi:predicted RNase H-like HicB family nuclease
VPVRLRRDGIIELLRQLPVGPMIDDAIETHVFIARIERGTAELDAGQGVPHDEVRRRFDELVFTDVIRPPQEPGDPLDDWQDIRRRRISTRRCYTPRSYVRHEVLDRDRTDRDWLPAYVPDVPGCIATGSTRDEVEQEMKGAIALHLDGLKAEGMAIPQPSSSSSYIEIPA